MKIFYCLLIIGLLAACKGNESPEQKAVDDASELYKKQPSDSTAQALVLALGNYAAVKGYADSTSARYILQAARISAEHDQLKQALGYYKTYMVEYPGRPDQADRLADVIAIQDKLQQPEINQVLYRSFASRFPQDPRTPDLQAKIENKEIAADSILRYIGMNMFNDSTFRLNEARANLYIDACEAAVMADPTLPTAPEFLHRSAETARTLRNIPQAIKLYDWIITKYPTSTRAATSLFLKAFTYDNDLKNFAEAGKYYNEFLAKYPNNEFAESAKFLLDNLGKSEAELKKMLEDKANSRKDSVQ